jgi:hypothetical protein
LFPLYELDTEYYSFKRRQKSGNLEHDVGIDHIHGINCKVYLMPDAQWEALAHVYAGVWVALGHQRTEGFSGPFDVAPRFPRDGQYVAMTVVDDYENHIGMMGHFHITRNKIDPCGFSWIPFENMVRGLYTEFRHNLVQNAR